MDKEGLDTLISDEHRFSCQWDWESLDTQSSDYYNTNTISSQWN